MAYYTATSASGNLVERVLNTAGQLLEAAALRRAQRRVYRKTLDELSTLSNRELADLGMARSHLRRIAWEAGQNVTSV